MTTSSTAAQQNTNLAVVTPTYFPDLTRCELLTESLDRLAPEIPHYLIVDRKDRAAFKHLERGSRRIIESEELLGRWIRRTPGRKGLWLSLKALPARGWIIQQILKIAAVDAVSEATLVFCDSDVAFLRPFDRTNLLVGQKLGLVDVPFINQSTRLWTMVARRLLGVPAQRNITRSYVGNMICWHCDIVRGMRHRIEQTTGMHWQIALVRSSSFSEYMLYGVFVREVLGYDSTDHSPSDVPLVKASWNTALTTKEELGSFFSDFDPRTIAVMVHSKDDIDPNRYRPYLLHFWDYAFQKEGATLQGKVGGANNGIGKQ